ncbi:MAG: Crp/Fnr family transcriptional regulator [Archangiaceae bacterium]|nr:Crp/Fnr family transcriptional regulator [Archangiaceae bacterium]
MSFGTAPHELPIASATPPTVPELMSARRLLEAHPVFAQVSLDCVTEMAAAGVVRNFRAGEFLARESEPAEHYWVLLKGAVRAFCTSATGQQVTVQLFAAPATWAENQLLHEQRLSESCVVVDRATVLQVPKREFLRIIWKYPALMLNVLRDASGRLLLANRRERSLALGDVSERLADLLMSYVRLFGVPTDGGTMIRIALSQNDLASDLGVALKSVSRAFKHLLTGGIVEKRGTRFVVKRPEALLAMASQVGLDWVSGRRLA